MNGEPAPLRADSDLETATENDDKLELKLWLRLLACATLIEGEIRGRLREHFEITLPRFDLLAQLDRAGDGLTMGELSNRLMVSNGNVTGLADRLESEGLIVRTPSSTDRRSQFIRLTTAGKRAFDQMTPAHERWIDEIFSGLERKEMAMLFALLGRLKRSARLAERPREQRTRRSP
ncbi:MAG: MarR family transcriptional regulator [Alphaproteobacteria bacterium]|nr:MarR family transcriptional regulator [Alphaproteobacteria bacterium]